MSQLHIGGVLHVHLLEHVGVCAAPYFYRVFFVRLHDRQAASAEGRGGEVSIVCTQLLDRSCSCHF